MVKIKSFVVLLFVLCIVFLGYSARSQPPNSGAIQPEAAAAVQANQDLATVVLSEFGIPERYDLYLGNGVDALVPLETSRNDAFMDWLQALFVQEAGWNFVKDQYVAQLNATFSEAELRELLALSEQPLISRLMQAEIDAYAASAGERRRLLSALWDNYNRGVFIPPQDIFQ